MKDPTIRFRTLFVNQTGQIGEDYVALLPGRLTLDRNWRAQRFFDGVGTLFKEVSIVPLRNAETPAMQALWCEPMEVRQETKDELLALLASRLRRVVADNWRPEACKVILHSSGLDSRLLSWTIKTLYEERGAGWLGQVLFVCSIREAGEFKKIMRYEGWSPDQYHVSFEGIDPANYHVDNLTDFPDLWRRMNLPSVFPLNFFWHMPRWAAIERLPAGHNTQVWHAQWGNTVLESPDGQRCRHAVSLHYYSILGVRPVYADEVVVPFTDIELARRAFRSSVKLGKHLRPALVKHLDPGLARFHNLHLGDDCRMPMPGWLWDRVERLYRDSWYGREVAPGLKPRRDKTIYFNDWWGHYTAASLCEHLVKNGYEITL